MAQSVLTSKGTVFIRRMIWKLKWNELHSPVEMRKRNLFDALIRKKLGTSTNPPTKVQPSTFISYSNDHEDAPYEPVDDDDPADSNGVATFEKPITDTLINTELQLL